MSNKPIHLHKNRVQNDANVLLLLIPAIVYILTLGLFLYGQKYQRESYQIATTTEPTVLGDESNLDNPF